MEQFFLFRRKRPKEIDEDDLDISLASIPKADPFVFEKTVSTEEEVVQWIKEIYPSYNHMVIRGEKIEFGVSEKIIVDVWKK